MVNAVIGCAQSMAVQKLYIGCTHLKCEGGSLRPSYHEYVCSFHRWKPRFTKKHDFVPFGICQDTVKLLLTFFFKQFEKLDVKDFLGSQALVKNLKKNETQNFKSLWSEGLIHKIWAKFETKVFFCSKGPFDVFLSFKVSMSSLWRTDMEVQTPLNVEIVVSMDF